MLSWLPLSTVSRESSAANCISSVDHAPAVRAAVDEVADLDQRRGVVVRGGTVRLDQGQGALEGVEMAVHVSDRVNCHGGR